VADPLEALNYFSRRFPSAWRLAEQFRQERNEGYRSWANWCYMPFNGWCWIVQNTEINNDDETEASHTAILAALGAWRYTQGIYRFHPEILSALLDTEIGGVLPAEVLFRLPEWCVFVDIPDTTVQGLAIDGFFAFLDDNNGKARLILVITKDRHFLPPLPIHLGNWTVAEALAQVVDLSKVKAIHGIEMSDEDTLEHGAKVCYPLLSLLLYICADEPEIEGREPGIYPSYPKSKKTKKGYKLFPPPAPRVWKLGYSTGEKLRQAKEAAERIEKERADKPLTRRAHVRRAHWHGYWTGSRKPKPDTPPEKQQRRFSYRWLHPMLVSGSEEESD